MPSASLRKRLRTGLRLKPKFFIKRQCMKFKTKFVMLLPMLVLPLNSSENNFGCQKFGVGNCLNMDNLLNVS